MTDMEMDVKLVDKTLKKVAKGTGIIFIGMIVGLTLELANRIIIIRSISRADYGLFSFGLAIFNLAAMISLGGLQSSVPRYLGYHRGKKDYKRLRGIIRAAFQAGLGFGIIASVIIFSSAEIIEGFFGLSGLKVVIQIFAIAIPLSNLIGLLSAIFRGFDNPIPQVYFRDFVERFSRFLLLMMIVFLGATLFSITLIYISSLAMASLAMALYYLLYKPKTIEHREKGKEEQIIPMRKELIMFSLPLFASVFLARFMNWTDILMLGYFKSADLVGLYSGGVTLARFIPFILNAGSLMFVPIFSALYSQKKLVEMKRGYAILTKWIFSATLPLFLVMFIFPHIILTFLFGGPYRGAHLALRILSLGFIFHVIMGLNGSTLMVMGKTNFLAMVSATGFGVNIVLNFILIPIYGIEGAAIATTTSYLIINIICSAMVYKISGIHPFTLNYVKPIIISIGIITMFIVIFHFLDAATWMMPFLFVLFILLYFFGILVSKSFDREDIMFLRTLERKIGIDLSRIRSILTRFT